MFAANYTAIAERCEAEHRNTYICVHALVIDVHAYHIMFGVLVDTGIIHRHRHRQDIDVEYSCWLLLLCSTLLQYKLSRQGTLRGAPAIPIA